MDAAAKRLARPAFTLVELLVVIAIISILAAMSFGALQLARESARERSTQATIAKLNNIIMRRYESYVTRRVPVRIPPRTLPRQAAEIRLAGLRDLMRMEMPDRLNNVYDPAGILPNGGGQMYSPALHILYRNILDAAGYDDRNKPMNYSHAKFLFLNVSVGSPESMEQFNQSEIAVDPTDGLQYFVDGWGRAIYFLRWAPGYSAYSQIQVDNHNTHHDPFDTRKVDQNGYALFPLIVSFGRDTNRAAFASGTVFGNLNTGNDVHFLEAGGVIPLTICGGGPYVTIGGPDTNFGAGAAGDITNHHIEQR